MCPTYPRAAWVGPLRRRRRQGAPGSIEQVCDLGAPRGRRPPVLDPFGVVADFRARVLCRWYPCYVSERSLKRNMDASCWVLLVAAIVLAVAPSRSQVAYAGSSDEPSIPRIEPQPRKTLLKWPGLTPGDNEGPDEPKRLDPDRPHLPESSTAVGKGRIVLESGYTFSEKGSSFTSQS